MRALYCIGLRCEVRGAMCEDAEHLKNKKFVIFFAFFVRALLFKSLV